MRTFVSFVIAVTILLFPQGLFAHPNCEKLQDVVESYLYDKHPDPSRPIRLAVYDTRDRRWYAYRWYQNRIEETPSAIDVAFTNDPTLFVRRGEDVAVLVARANPLLYTTEVTSMTRADIEGLAEIRKLAAVLGSSVQSFAASTAVSLSLLPPPTPPEAPLAAVESFNEAMEAAGESQRSRKTVSKEISLAQYSVKPLVEEFLTALKEHHDVLKTAIDTHKPAIKAAQGRILDVDETRAEIAEALQSAELGTHSPLAAPTVVKLATLHATARGEFDGAVAAATALGKTEPACTASVSALQAVLGLVIEETPIDPDEAEDMRRSLRAELRKLRTAPLADDCPPKAETADLHDAIEKLAEWLRDPENRAAAAADEKVNEMLTEARLAASEYGKAVALRGKLIAGLEEIDDERPASLKLAAQLQQFGTLYGAQEIDDSKCWMTAGVVEVDRVNQAGFKLPWFQVQTEEFAMTVRPMFVEDVARDRADVGGKYTFSRGDFGFGVDTALIYTRAHDREYKGVAEKVDEDVNEDGKMNDADTRFFIRETARTDRTGKLALMLTVSPPRLRGFGAQFGLGTDTDNPAAYIGLTRSLGRFARISAGHTQQRVTRLGRGVSPGDEVSAADDVRTRKAFDASWYAALAFTISELPIFKAD